MKKYIKIIIASAISALSCACVDTNYPGGEISPYIGIYDVRNLYKGETVDLNLDNLGGSSKLAAVVSSDHSGNNIPAELIFIQDCKRLDFLRGIALNLGVNAKDYKFGDSIVVDILNTKLNRVNGILEISNIDINKIQKVATAKTVTYQRANIAQIIANPNNYESTYTVIVKGGFNPIPADGITLSGELMLNDGFGNLTLSTNNDAVFSKNKLYRMANYYGLVFTKLIGDSLVPYLKPMRTNDIVELKSTYAIPKVIITGWSNDPAGTDNNNEYIQFMATEDINFSETPYSVFTTNNAGASTPTGYPISGWVTGGLRTYKFNLTSGVAKKGQFFYVGGTNKLINSTGSTSMGSANWITVRNYGTTNGADGIGDKTTNLLANSGNAYGIAIFKGIKINSQSIPEDVLFVGSGGSLIGNGNGFRITNTDFYDVINPITLESQPFFRSGSNTNNLTYNTPSDAGYFNILGGEFNMTLGRWIKSRAKYALLLQKNSTIEEIENPAIVTRLIY